MEQEGGSHKAIGSRAQVMHGTAHHTSGGLTKKDLKYNKWGRIVSQEVHAGQEDQASREGRIQDAQGQVWCNQEGLNLDFT
jgi:hypothetical protein